MGLLVGTLVSNIIVILVSIIFVIEQITKKDTFVIKNSNFYFLLVIYFYLIVNSIFISENLDSIIRSLGFLRFILLTFAISYYFNLFSKQIWKNWLLIS